MSQPITNLSVGDKIKFGNYAVESETPEAIEWIIASKDHNSKDGGYPSNAMTLLTNQIIDLRGFDAKEPNNSDSDRQSYGNNRYRDSNIRQWLNSNGLANSWWSATHGDDEAPTDSGTNNHGTGYEDKDGFLNSFTSEELSKILNTDIKAAVCDSPDGGGVDNLTDKIFLLSQVEVNGGTTEISASDGSILSLFESATDADRIAQVSQQVENYSNYDKTGDWHWWTRSARASFSYYARHVTSSGSMSSYLAYNGSSGVRPALNLQSDLLVSDSTDVDGAYTIIYNESPIISLIETNYPNITFTADDTDGNIASLKITINDIEKQVYSTFDGELSYSIDYNDLSIGDNSLKIIAVDDQGTETIKELNINKSEVATPAIGTEIIIGNKKYEITNTEVDGLNLNLTLSSPLEKNVVIDEKIEIMTNYVKPEVDFLDGLGYKELEFINTSQDGEYIIEEYLIEGSSRKVNFKFKMSKESDKTLNLKEPKAIFGYGGE